MNETTESLLLAYFFCRKFEFITKFPATHCRLDPVLFQAGNKHFCSFQKLPLNYLPPPSCVLASTLIFSQESLR